jgi:hypothetical protein
MDQRPDLARPRDSRIRRVLLPRPSDPSSRNGSVRTPTAALDAILDAAMNETARPSKRWRLAFGT